MLSRTPRIDRGPLVERPPARADLVLSVRAPGGSSRLLARNASTGRFHRLSVPITGWPASPLDAIPAEAAMRLYALSPDGEALLFGDPVIGGARISLYTLASGTVATLPDGPGSRPVQAAFSPDGKQLATLEVIDFRATVTVLDTDGGRRRELWSADGGTSSDTAVSWSPDGRFVGVTYVDDEDGDHTVVLTGNGTVGLDLPGMSIVGISGLGWTGAHDLLLDHEFWETPPAPTVLVDVVTGARREVEDRSGLRVLGALDGRLLRPAGRGSIASTEFDGSDPRPMIDAGPDHGIEFFDATPGASVAGS